MYDFFVANNARETIQPQWAMCHRYCSNLSGGVALIVRFNTNGMCVKNNTIMNVTRTSNNRVTMACELYCSLLAQCEALRICRSGFLIATQLSCANHFRLRELLSPQPFFDRYVFSFALIDAFTVFVVRSIMLKISGVT